MIDARALWITGPGTVALRDEVIARTAGDVLVETLFSGISRGTEALVLRGGVPASEHARMRAPLQAGAFPWPVKYGYAAVGRVSTAPPTSPAAPSSSSTPTRTASPSPPRWRSPCPEAVPPERAVLAANMETALNVVWDAGAAPGDRIAVVGAGTVGALVAWLCARLPGADVTLVDTNPARAALAAALGCAFAAPEAAPADCDLVVHASASAEGLATALAAAGEEATIVEASWYGDRAVPLAARRRLPQPPPAARRSARSVRSRPAAAPAGPTAAASKRRSPSSPTRRSMRS